MSDIVMTRRGTLGGRAFECNEHIIVFTDTPDPSLKDIGEQSGSLKPPDWWYSEAKVTDAVVAREVPCWRLSNGQHVQVLYGVHALNLCSGGAGSFLASTKATGCDPIIAVDRSRLPVAIVMPFAEKGCV